MSIIGTTIILIIRMIATIFSFEFSIIIDNFFSVALKITFIILFIFVNLSIFLSHFFVFNINWIEIRCWWIAYGIVADWQKFLYLIRLNSHRRTLIYLKPYLMNKTYLLAQNFCWTFPLWWIIAFVKYFVTNIICLNKWPGIFL